MDIKKGIIKIVDGQQIIGFEGDLEYSKFKNLEEQISIIEKYNANKELNSIFLTNFLELTGYLQTAVNDLVSNQVYVLDENREKFQLIYMNSNRLLLNVLTSGRTLLDHSETYLKRKYGKDSKEFIDFKSLTSEIYDLNYEYRFIYKLRNYSQHCGLPISSISYTVRNLMGVNTAKLNPVFIREKLLSNYKEWGQTVRDDIFSRTEEFPVMPIISEYYRCIQEIVSGLFQIEKKSLVCSLQNIQDIIGVFRNEEQESQLCVFYDFEYSVPNSYENSNFKVLNIPKKLIQEIKGEIGD